MQHTNDEDQGHVVPVPRHVGLRGAVQNPVPRHAALRGAVQDFAFWSSVLVGCKSLDVYIRGGPGLEAAGEVSAMRTASSLLVSGSTVACSPSSREWSFLLAGEKLPVTCLQNSRL